MHLTFLKNKIKAFTLIESLVSISIILIAVLGPLTLTLNSVNAIMQNKNRVIASYLAEEIIEDFRAYRDGIVITCTDMQINYDSFGDLVNGYCKKGMDTLGQGILIDKNLLENENGEIEYTNREVAWKLFMERLINVTNNEFIFLDKNSFDYTYLSNITPYANCYMVLSSNSGYLCSTNDSNLFKRDIKITKNTNRSLKIEVQVRYATSYIYGNNDKYVKIVDYIYER